MAKLRMTYKNLKALRKSREYQAVIIDLVNAGILTKSKAEEMLEYNIPAALLGAEDTGSDTPIVTPDPDEPGEGGEGGESGGGGTSEQGGETTETIGGEGGEQGGESEIELPVLVYGNDGVSISTVSVGRVTISVDNIANVKQYPFNDPWFTSNENWSNDYSNSDLYRVVQVNIGTSEAALETNDQTTAAEEFAMINPETMALVVELAANTSSSSS